jgi:hypothetical protein
MNEAIHFELVEHEQLEELQKLIHKMQERPQVRVVQVYRNDDENGWCAILEATGLGGR